MPYVLGADSAKCIEKLAGANPFGEDPRYDSTFLDLRAEVQKLTAMSSKEGGVDWKAMKKWSLEILSTKAKDLNCASYLTLSLFVVDGYKGMADGLAILHHFVSQYWDGMHPAATRPKPRANAMEWLVSRLSPLVLDREPKPDDGPALAEAVGLVEKIQEVTRARLLGDAPPMSELEAALTSRAEALAPPPAPVAEAAPEPSASQPVATPAQAAAAPVVGRAAGAPAGAPAQHVSVPTVELTGSTSTEQIKAAALPVIHALRKADPLDPTSYRMLRAIVWDSRSSAPPADPNSGKTRVPAPRAQDRAMLEALLGSGNWAGLLEQSEGFLAADGTWWLDLQRYTVVAIEKLDSTRGPKTAEAVKGEITRFLDRVGNISNLMFSNDSPVATEVTRQWLAEIESGAGGGGGGGVSLVMMAAPSSGGGDATVFEQKEIDEVKLHFGKKRLAQALDILQRGIERAGKPRAKFRARLIAGRACLEAEQEDWARTLLEESLRDMETFTFERWEQDLAVETYQLLANAYARVAKERKEQRDSLRLEIDKIKSKLFRLDMRAAAMVDELLRR